jgi:hypothetical protein
VHSINKRVEQNQLDLKECLKYHHPSSSDDEANANGLYLCQRMFDSLFLLSHFVIF